MATMLTKMKMLAAAGTLLMTSMIAAAPANASDLFGSTNSNTNVTLTFDGATPYIATDSGWITSTGTHTSANQNYVVGSVGSGTYNDYFSFVIGSAAPVSPYTSAVLSIRNGSSVGPYPFTYTLFDVSATPAQLDTFRNSGDAVGQALYADLGSGTSYGSATITGATSSSTFTTIILDQAFLDQVNSGQLTSFSIGGTLAPTAIVPSVDAVPEPATWAMMILGMGAVGFSMRGAARRSERKFNAKIKRITDGAVA